MSATTRPPGKKSDLRRPLKLSSLEILGFSNSSSEWSDSPVAVEKPPKRGRHETTVADTNPQDFGVRLTGGNMRWGLTATLLIVGLGITGLGYWLYQRPAAQEQAAVASVTARASDLQSVIPILVAFNERLVGTDPADAESDLFAVEGAARSLFDVTGDLGDSQAGKRAASSQASASTLDAVRLAGEARSYRAAVTPLLVAPELETDRSFIELDEAARFFGDWQLSFDQVRTALPETVMEDVTEQLDILGGDLTSYLGRYVDALRDDDQGAAETVVSDLGRRLAEIGTVLNTTLEEVQARVDARIQEATTALELILGR